LKYVPGARLRPASGSGRGGAGVAVQPTMGETDAHPELGAMVGSGEGVGVGDAQAATSKQIKSARVI
ncbi:MAG: hypothetical protein QOJ81_285, partial [Chloroflexota bacterium]|nr:hypothetical protein [Chloroflexota bacterium]